MKKIVIKLILAFIMFEGTSCINDPIIISPDLAFRAEATTGEGSIWHPDRNTLFWVDIEGKTLYEYIPDLQNCRSWQFDRMVSTVIPETYDLTGRCVVVIHVFLVGGPYDPIGDRNFCQLCFDGSVCPYTIKAGSPFRRAKSHGADP